MFHRQDMHKALLDAAVSLKGEGIPAKCMIDHVCTSVDYENGEVTFANGVTARGDLIIGGDGIRVRGHLSDQFRRRSVDI
jgi:salicylate hydroxylase